VRNATPNCILQARISNCEAFYFKYLALRETFRDVVGDETSQNAFIIDLIKKCKSGESASPGRFRIAVAQAASNLPTELSNSFLESSELIVKAARDVHLTKKEGGTHEACSDAESNLDSAMRSWISKSSTVNQYFSWKELGAAKIQNLVAEIGVPSNLSSPLGKLYLAVTAGTTEWISEFQGYAANIVTKLTDIGCLKIAKELDAKIESITSRATLAIQRIKESDHAEVVSVKHALLEDLGLDWHEIAAAVSRNLADICPSVVVCTALGAYYSVFYETFTSG
jgi:hypothetical protein